MIRPKKVGHVVLKARNIDQVEQFYTQIMGFEVVHRLAQPRGVFFSLGEQHHDLAVLEVPPEADDPKDKQVGSTTWPFRSKALRRSRTATTP